MLLNVIIPCFNVEKYIARCLDSVILNDYKDINVICINDGSKDTTKNIIKEYCTKYPYIHLIDKNNGGPSSARNAGLDYVDFKRAGYITFIDADDYIDEDYFSNMIDILNAHHADVICASFYYAGSKGTSKAFTLKDDLELSPYDALIKIFEDQEIKSMSHHKIFKTSLWKDIRYPNDLFFLEDTVTIFKALIKANKTVLTDYAGYYYNQENNGSIMQIISNKKILSGWNALIILNDYDFSSFDEVQQENIKQRTINLLADNFLELYPRFNVKEDKKSLKMVKQYIKTNKVIKQFKATNRKLKMKRRTYLLFPFLYRFLFKCYNALTK